MVSKLDDINPSIGDESEGLDAWRMGFENTEQIVQGVAPTRNISLVDGEVMIGLSKVEMNVD